MKRAPALMTFLVACGGVAPAPHPAPAPGTIAAPAPNPERSTQPSAAAPATESHCEEGQRDDVVSLTCALERAPAGSTEERIERGWPGSHEAVVCRVIEPCGRLPERARLDPFFLTPGDFTIDEARRAVRVAFFPTDCAPRSLLFRTTAVVGAAAAPDHGGGLLPNLTDVRGATRGTQSLEAIGGPALTTFTLDLATWCRTP